MFSYKYTAPIVFATEEAIAHPTPPPLIYAAAFLEI